MHLRRTAQQQGYWFLPYLQPGMSLLDCGCATGSITVGRAAVVAPGQVIGVDHSNVLVYEDLWEVTLVSHSYGGMVITGVAEAAPERIGHLIYLDAFVPQDGQSVGDLVPTLVPYLEGVAAQFGDG